MKKILRRLWISEEGNMSVLMAGFIVLMLAVCGIVIDTGLVIEGKLKLYSATKAAAQATYEAYDRDLWADERIVRLDENVATDYAVMYLNLNLPEAELIFVEVKDSKPNEAEIKTKLKVDFIFMRLFGIESYEVYSGFVSTVG
jgi:Flp pilus assembly protein TadG